MWVYSISPPSLSLIDALTADIYHWSKKSGNHTPKHTHRNRNCTDTLTKLGQVIIQYKIGSSEKEREHCQCPILA